MSHLTYLAPLVEQLNVSLLTQLTLPGENQKGWAGNTSFIFMLVCHTSLIVMTKWKWKGDKERNIESLYRR